MSAQIYIRHPSGRQRICSEDELGAYKAQGWSEQSRVKVEAKPAPKKKAASKKKAK